MNTKPLKDMTDKENAILCVLQQRAYCCERSIDAHKKEIAARQKQIDYLQAKKEGYYQAIELVKESLDNIMIELK